MKSKIFLVLILALSSLNTFSQACGMYKVKIIGKIVKSEKVFDSINVPRIRFFDIQNIEEKDNFINIKIENDEFNIETTSNLTSHLYDNADDLKKHFIENRKVFPIILYENIDGKIKQTKIDIDWEKIEIKKIENTKFGSFFEINLKEINTFEN